MRDHRRDIPMEEIKHPIVYPSKSHPKFVNAVSQEVGLWSSEFMAKLYESSQRHAPLVLGLVWQAIQPRQ